MADRRHRGRRRWGPALHLTPAEALAAPPPPPPPPARSARERRRHLQAGRERGSERERERQREGEAGCVGVACACAQCSCGSDRGRLESGGDVAVGRLLEQIHRRRRPRRCGRHAPGSHVAERRDHRDECRHFEDRYTATGGHVSWTAVTRVIGAPANLGLNGGAPSARHTCVPARPLSAPSAPLAAGPRA